MTITICARDEESGSIGIGICSSSPAVAGRCIAVNGKLGAVASQNLTDPGLKAGLFRHLSAGSGPEEAISNAVLPEPSSGYRQVLLVDCFGRTAGYTGMYALAHAGHEVKENVVAGGNLLKNKTVPTYMIRAFNESRGQALESRLIQSLMRALEVGGELGAITSAGLLVADGDEWCATDLRVDWHPRPLEKLEELWRLWSPQKAAYVMRAKTPEDAPAYEY